MLSWLKKAFGQAEALPRLSDWEKTCPDCGAEDGRLHDLFCTKEQCPFCRGQLMSCDCMEDVLGLGKEERQVVEEYINDSVEPLQGIMSRWKAALNEKGRIPFKSIPLSPTADGLILAAARGNLPFVRALLAAGVPLDATNDVHYTPLMAAAFSYRVEVVLFLLQAGADVQRRDVHGRTPLHCATGSPSSAADQQCECVRLLIKRGAVIDALNESGDTPLMGAAWFGCLSSVALLLKHGASASIRDDRGHTAEDLARQRGHTEIAGLLAARS